MLSGEPAVRQDNVRGEVVVTKRRGREDIYEVRAGIEPAHRSFADSRVSTSPTDHSFYSIRQFYQTVEALGG